MDPANTTDSARAGTTESSGLAVRPSGKILYRSVESGRPSIWSMNADGGARTQLTTEGTASMPAFAPDGRSMIFVRDLATTLWRMDLETQSEVKISGAPPVQYPRMTPDGQTILFTSAATGVERLWKMPAAGGAATQMIDGTVTRPAVSPDGKQVAFYYQESRATPWVLAVMPIDGTRPTATFRVTPSVAWCESALDDRCRALLHNSGVDDRSNIWLQPIAGGEPRKLTRFADQIVIDFDRSADGKTLIISRGVLNRDAVLIRHFQ